MHSLLSMGFLSYLILSYLTFFYLILLLLLGDDDDDENGDDII